MTPTQIAAALGGDYYVFDYRSVDIAETYLYGGGSWGFCTATEDIALGDTITASGEGAYTVSITLFHLDTFTSSHVEWVGTGVTVEYTLDGIAWTTLAQDGIISLAGDPDFDIRVSFADETSELVSLAVYVLKSNVITTPRGYRPTTFSGAMIADEGIKLAGGAYLDLAAAPASDTMVPIKTVEFWARKDDATNGIIFQEDTHGLRVDAANNISWGVAGGYWSIYVDDVLAVNGVTHIADGFHHYKIVFTTEVNTALRIGGRLNGTEPVNMTMSHLALYGNNPSNLYSLPQLVVADTSTITVTEASPVVDVYAYAWSVISG